MTQYILKIFKDHKWILFYYCLGMILLLWMYAYIYPTIAQQTDVYQQMIQAMPKDMMKAFGIEEFGFSTFESFISAEVFSITWPMLVSFLMISLAGNAIAGLVEKGTIELDISQPISRTKMYLANFGYAKIALIIFVLFSIFSIPVFGRLYNFDIEFVKYAKISLYAFLFGLSVYSIAMFLSSIFSDKGKVYAISGGLMVLMYVLNIISNLKENLDKLKYASLFHYFDYNEVLLRNNLSWTPILVFLGIVIVFSFAGLFVFNKRDIAV